MGDTKEKILDTALTMFSRTGYYGTSMNDIAASIGLTKAALYRHFESKDDILNCLTDRIDRYYAEHIGPADRVRPVPDSAEDLIDMTMRMVTFTVRDSTVVRVRRILTLEQYRSGRIRDLATFHFMTYPETVFTEIFRGMAAKGLIRDDNPAMLAFAYTSPISALIRLADREPEKREDCVCRIRAFAEHFIKVYGRTPE